MIARKNYLQLLKRFALRAVCLLMVTVAVWGGAFSSSAYAAGSEAAGAVMNDRAAAELDRVAGAGTSDQLEGAVDGVVGKAKRDIGRVSGDLDDLDAVGKRLDGAADSLKGKVKRDVGRTKSAASDLSDEVEDSADGLVDSIKDLFD